MCTDCDEHSNNSDQGRVTAHARVLKEKKKKTKKKTSVLETHCAAVCSEPPHFLLPLSEVNRRRVKSQEKRSTPECGLRNARERSAQPHPLNSKKRPDAQLSSSFNP